MNDDEFRPPNVIVWLLLAIASWALIIGIVWLLTWLLRGVF